MWVGSPRRRGWYRSQRGYVVLAPTPADWSPDYWNPQPAWWNPPTTFGTTVRVNAGDNLQTAINNAAAASDGRTLVLERGATFTGSFYLGINTNPTVPITICTDGIQDGSYAFPTHGEEMAPGHASAGALAALVTTATAAQATLHIPNGVKGWNIRGIKIAPTGTSQLNGIFRLGGDHGSVGTFEWDWDQVPRYIYIDRVLLDIPTSHRMNANNAALHIRGRDIKVRGTYARVYDVLSDYKSLEIQYADGVQIDDSTLWGGSETMFAGGGGTAGDPYGIGHILPRNIIFRRSIIGKDHIQQKLDGWGSKNILETKKSKNVWFEGCWIDQNADTSADTGQSNIIMLVHYPLAQPDGFGGNDLIPYNTMENWSWKDCAIGRAYQMLAARGFYAGELVGSPTPFINPHQTVADQEGGKKITFDNCLLYKFNSPAYQFALYDGFQGLRMRHCTYDGRLWDGSERYTAMFFGADPYVVNAEGGPTYVKPFYHFEVGDNIWLGFSGKILDDNDPLGTGYKYNQAHYAAYIQPYPGNFLTHNLWTSADDFESNVGWSFSPTFGTSDTSPNWRRVTASPADIFTNAATKDYRLNGSSGAPYRSGAARQATDGRDLGCDWAQMYSTMGARVWTAAGFPFTP